MGAHSLPRRNLAVKALFSVAILGGSLFTLAQTNAGAAATWTTVQPGTFTGYAFDACTAPSSAAMKAWKAASPYKALGIYIGGVNRGCTQANLTPAWVREQVEAGWKLLPLYVGPQATCSTSTKSSLIDNPRADAQGRATASDAIAQATALGLAPQSVLIYDLEAYDTTDATCRTGVFKFMNGWTARLHDNGYLSGFYSSLGSGVADQIAHYATPGYSRPDYLDFARWDGVVTVSDPAIPSGDWSPHRRMKQYLGGHQETWGGVTINIDNDYVDFAALPGNKMADFTKNGWSDVLARNSSGVLSIYQGNGVILSTTVRTVSTGWQSMNAIVRIGDLNRDGKEDLVACQTNGDLWFYPGTATGKVGARSKLTTKWNAYREITPIGDLNKDGYPDLLAAGISDKKLYLYPGKAGAKFSPRISLGGGWNTMSELAGVGDFNRDGFPDMIARLTSNGALYLYPGKKNGFAARTQIGTGWSGFRDLVGVGDFDRDGYVDLAAVRKSDNSLLLYRGNGKTLTAGPRLGGFAGLTPLL